jgi:WD40 repeat protein
VAPFLAGTSWNQEVRIWEVAQNGDSRPHLMYKHAAPVLDCVWSHSGDQVFSAGCDNKVMCQDIRQGKLFQVAAHEKPIRKVKWAKEFPALVTGSWDKTCKFWDLRASTPQANVDLPERLYAMDVKVDGLLFVFFFFFCLNFPQNSFHCSLWRLRNERLVCLIVASWVRLCAGPIVRSSFNLVVLLCFQMRRGLPLDQ